MEWGVLPDKQEGRGVQSRKETEKRVVFNERSVGTTTGELARGELLFSSGFFGMREAIISRSVCGSCAARAPGSALTIF